MHLDRYRQLLAALKDVLIQSNEARFVEYVDGALAESDEGLETFLVSNELWGGPGSIADEAGMDLGREGRRPIEAALVRLGKAQVQGGLVNIRTAGWVDAFQSWQNRGI